MKLMSNLSKAVVLCVALSIEGIANAQNIAAAHWINESAQSGATVLNGGGVFTTDFKGTNDLKITPLAIDPVTYYVDLFGGSTPGNNPAYMTNFVGSSANGTGDGTPGDIGDLEMTYDATGSLQFDFATPLTPQDRILLIDVDRTEQYLIQAYAFNGISNAPVSLTGWNAQNFSGTTGITPNSTWPIWTPATGTLVSGTSSDLNEELFVLTPNQNINRLVITKQTGSGFSTDITFLSLNVPLMIHQTGANVVLNWTNSAFGLMAAPVVNGTYTNVTGATSPYTNAISGSQGFFYLKPN